MLFCGFETRQGIFFLYFISFFSISFHVHLFRVRIRVTIKVRKLSLVLVFMPIKSVLLFAWYEL